MSLFAVGSLVKTRGREWVVLPGDDDPDMLHIRPLGGREEESTAVYLPLENVEPARFDLPTADHIGDHRSCRLLRDALRLGFRSSAGPFRSFAKVAVEPRPYQLVPLLMALKLDPVRLLIADDVGIGKTIEACLVARELLDRGEIRRIGVLCPPHLAEQWQQELSEKFHIDAELVLASTANKLERKCNLNESIFEVYPHVVVSMDFIKTPRHKDEFLRSSPDLVIVDEAHSCTYGGMGRGGRQLRWELVSRLAQMPNKHLVLVTATPHSGKEENFRSLLSFLDADFANLPSDLAGSHNEKHRRRLAQYFIQRRRADIEHYMNSETEFPKRQEKEDSYKLSTEYAHLFDRVLDYARESVIMKGDTQYRQRVRWWSALALLRSLASSPASAAATLRSRAAMSEEESLEDIDETGRRMVLDLEGSENAEVLDITPGSDVSEISSDQQKTRNRLLQLARDAEALSGDKDEKLKKAIRLIKQMVSEGCKPIIFCRFIHTAEYVANALRDALPKNTEVAHVTGNQPPAEREERILQLAESPNRVLVCTDCLSEGINLQAHFDAVFHYDLAWSPTRHEQREGRVDRYGQPQKNVRVLTYYGLDNKIDGIVLDVLIRKHQKIRSSLGISVSVPVETNQVIEAIFEGILLRGERVATAQMELFDDDAFKPKKEEFFKAWENASEREKRSRTMFAQETIKVEEVAKELEEAREAVGAGASVPEFMVAAIEAHQGNVDVRKNRFKFNLHESPIALRDSVRDFLKKDESLTARFELPVDEDTFYLHRTHPVVENVASYVLTAALDPHLNGSSARRAGVIRTTKVDIRTTLLLVRYRYHIITKMGNEEYPLLAEDCQLLAFTGPPENAQWLSPQVAQALLHAEPDASREVPLGQAQQTIQRVIEQYPKLIPRIDQMAHERGKELLDAHRRVRDAAHQKGMSYRVEPNLPADILGIYVYLP